MGNGPDKAIGYSNGWKGFGGDSHGWGSSRLELTPLGGSKVQPRWRLSADGSIGFLGWYVDDIEIYNCGNVPDTPTAVVATGGDQSATVTWEPAGGNGSTATSYTITAAPGGNTVTVPAGQSTATITGLTNGTPYTFTVTATNEIGSSSPSGASNEVTPVDTTPPSGYFVLSHTNAWANFTEVTISQEGLSDNTTPTDLIVRAVDFGTGMKPWPTGSEATFVYTRAGSYPVRVMLTDAAGNAQRVDVGTITVGSDTTAPTVALKRPATRADYVSSWSQLHGTATDLGVGVDAAQVRLIERRSGTWYAYVPRSHTWKRAGTSATKAWSRAGTAALEVSPAQTWRLPVSGLRKGNLAVQVRGSDKLGQTSRWRAYSQVLRR